MPESQIAPEPVRIPERPISYTPLLGLQGRLSVGGNALFYTQQVELKGGFDNKNGPATIALMENASMRERKAYWSSQAEQAKDVQLSKWKTSVVEKVTAIPRSTIGKDHADFFVKMGIDVAHFNDDNAQALYNKYFSKELAGKGVDIFAKDIITAFTIGGKLDASALKNHLPALQWMAGMFGKNSAEIVTQLLDAEMDNTIDKDAFVANRKDKVNDLSAHEVALLTFLTEGTTPEVTPPSPSPEPMIVTPVKKVVVIEPEKDPAAIVQSKEDDLLCLLANKKSIAEVDMDTLALEYRNNPIALIKKMQERTSAIALQMKKEGKSESEIKRYIRAYLNAQIILDHKAFPPDDVVRKGVPTYIPDGLSDMGSDKEPNDKKRTGREKIRIDKEKIFESSIDSYYTHFTTEFPPTLSQKDKEIKITEAISRFIHDKIKYDYHDKLAQVYGAGQSINMSTIESLNLGVCRHHALDTQVLLQSLGIDSRLMKSDFTTESNNHGPHVNNLVHIDGAWYLLDTTNPEYSNDAAHTQIVFMKKLSEKNIDLNSQVYTWTLDKTEADGTKKKRKYVSRNNMYYRIRDNKANPVPLHYVKP